MSANEINELAEIVAHYYKTQGYQTWVKKAPAWFARVRIGVAGNPVRVDVYFGKVEEAFFDKDRPGGITINYQVRDRLDDLTFGRSMTCLENPESFERIDSMLAKLERKTFNEANFARWRWNRLRRFTEEFERRRRAEIMRGSC